MDTPTEAQGALDDFNMSDAQGGNADAIVVTQRFEAFVVSDSRRGSAAVGPVSPSAAIARVTITVSEVWWRTDEGYIDLVDRAISVDAIEAGVSFSADPSSGAPQDENNITSTDAQRPSVLEGLQGRE